ncbi:MAG: sulfotransferase [Alphaproteobacteria bacterium]
MRAAAERVDTGNEAAHWRAIGDANHAAGDAAAGGAAHLKALAASTKDPDMLRAGAALHAGDLPVAEQVLRAQLKRHPTDIAAMRMLAELGIRVGRLSDAQALLDRALELAPEFEAARFARALLLARRNRLAEALTEIDALLARAPDNAGFKNLKATILVRFGEYEPACALYEDVLANSGARNDPRIWMSYGHVLKTTGRAEEGAEAYRRSLALRPELGESWWSLANLKTLRFGEAEIAAMEAALASPQTDESDRLHLHFALGKAFEDSADFARSFTHYAQGNAIRRSQIEYDATETTEKVRAAKALLTPQFFAARAGHGCSARDPIFIIGLPRSGSTLLEQILASHAEIEGTMELPDIDMMARRIAAKADGDAAAALAQLSADECRGLGEEYLDRTRIQRHDGKPFFIDKMPNNWLHVGFIQLILPNAKIIDARRHPMACCFSAWKQHFARGQHFSFDLRELGRYYADYADYMAHIDAVLPGHVHRVIHESLVDDLETETRNALSYIGVPFDAACLEFYNNDRAVRTPSAEQVRQPISRAGVEKWKHYEAWLEPLAVELADLTDNWKSRGTS